MNSLQLELDSINSQLELLTYRKTQLDSIMSEYSDVINRVKNLVLSMEDANVEPTNLLMEIEGLIYCPEPETTPEELPTESEEQETDTVKPDTVKPDTVETEAPQLNALGLPVQTSTPEPETLQPEVEPVPTPEPVRLMALVPSVSTETQPTKTQLNNKAWRRGDTLLIGFDNKRLMISWAKWFNESFNGGVFVKDDEQLDGFKYCLSVLWYGSNISTNWERLTALDYSFKPDEQPTGISLDDVRNVIQTLQNNGVKFISKGELLAHHLNSLKASDLEEYLETLAEEGLIILGNKSIDLCVKPVEQKQNNPTFEYTEVDDKRTKIYSDGMLLGIAKDCGTHWESPQFPGQSFPNRRDVVAALWQLVNQF